jgi:hypothetical protein
MKLIHLFSLLSLAFFCCFATSITAATTIDSTGLPGDHFSLEGALELFKKADSPEDFEKQLNEEKNYVNNLDLNEDGDVDYIRVIDHVEGDVHAIVLQVPVNEKESQDIAVIEIEKTGEETAMLQIIGDETLYGENIIVEPSEETAESTGKGGPSADYEARGIVVNVWAWPSVRFVYRPAYRPWVSPWRWAVYPRWWSPWRPSPWRVHYTRVAVYRPRYRVVSTHRVVRAHRVYTPRRTTSVVVRSRTTAVRVNKATPNRTATSRKKTTTVVGKNNGKPAVGQKKTTVTRKQTPRGTVTKKQTTTRGVKKGKNGNKAGAKRSTTTVRKRRN